MAEGTFHKFCLLANPLGTTCVVLHVLLKQQHLANDITHRAHTHRTAPLEKRKLGARFLEEDEEEVKAEQVQHSP